ncbi:MAG: hypothetical protein ABIJ44_01430, partial [Pseudomonadota bacterium]
MTGSKCYLLINFPTELTKSISSSRQRKQAAIDTNNLKGNWGTLSISDTVRSSIPTTQPCHASIAM